MQTVFDERLSKNGGFASFAVSNIFVDSVPGPLRGRKTPMAVPGDQHPHV